MSKANPITAHQLRELVDYDPESGVFRWRHNSRHTKAGAQAGCTRSDGYKLIGIVGHNCYSHRLAWAWVNGEWPTLDIDHIDGDPSNNRITNLRQVTHKQNHENRRRARSNKRSCSLLGATWDKRKNRWGARIRAGNADLFLGYFDSAEAAHEVYLSAKRELHQFGTI